ncbi:MAG: hypothetical protein EHM52_03890, partial [Actinomycetota bacterium]
MALQVQQARALVHVGPQLLGLERPERAAPGLEPGDVVERGALVDPGPLVPEREVGAPRLVGQRAARTRRVAPRRGVLPVTVAAQSSSLPGPPSVSLRASCARSRSILVLDLVDDRTHEADGLTLGAGRRRVADTVHRLGLLRVQEVGDAGVQLLELAHGLEDADRGGEGLHLDHDGPPGGRSRGGVGAGVDGYPARRPVTRGAVAHGLARRVCTASSRHRPVCRAPSSWGRRRGCRTPRPRAGGGRSPVRRLLSTTVTYLLQNSSHSHDIGVKCARGSIRIRGGRTVTVQSDTSARSLGKLADAFSDPTRRAILHHVLEAETPVSAGEVGDVFGVHRTVARAHLEKLVETGLLETATRRRATGGRPAKTYTSSGERLEVMLPPRRYEPLARLLLDVVDR